MQSETQPPTSEEIERAMALLARSGFVVAPHEVPLPTSSETELKPVEQAASRSSSGEGFVSEEVERDEIRAEVRSRIRRLPVTDGAFVVPRKKEQGARVALRCKHCNAMMAPPRSGTRSVCDNCVRR